jgi:hypothetical protein
MLNSFQRWIAVCQVFLVIPAFCQMSAQVVKTSRVVFQQGLDGYEGTFQMRLGAAGENDLGEEVVAGQYDLDGSPFNKEGDDKVDILRFDGVFGQASGKIPLGATILDAEITYMTGTGVNAHTRGVYHVAMLVEEVNELSLYDDWPLNPPGLRGPRGAARIPFGAGTGAVGNQTTFTIDVTDYVQAWSNGEPNHGTILFANDSTDGLQVSTISNEDIGKRPSLTVTYTTEEVILREFRATRSALVRSNTPTVDGATIEVGFLDYAPGDITESLFFFEVFGGNADQITTEMIVIGAKLVLQTSGGALGDLPGYDTGADTPQAFDVRQMFVDWDPSSAFGEVGLNEIDGSIGPVVGRFYGMGEWARATVDVTRVLNNWKAGQKNFGFNVTPAEGSTNGWQIFFPGTVLEEFRPKLRVLAVRVPGLPTAVAKVNKASGQAPLEVSLDASESSAANGGTLAYHWDLGDGTTMEGVSLRHVFAAGAYDVLLTVTDSEGNQARSIVAVTAMAPPIAEFSAVRLEGLEPFHLVADASSSFDPDGGSVQIEWDFGDGATASGILGDHIYRQGGDFDITLSVIDDEGFLSKSTRSITVWETSMEQLRFQQGLDGYMGTVQQAVRADGTIDLGQDVEVYFLDGHPQNSNQAANDAVDLIRFDDMVGDAPNQIPANATVIRASLIFHTGSSPVADTDGPYVIGFLTQSFDETTDYEAFDTGSGVPGERGPRGGLEPRYLAGYAQIALLEVVSADVTPYVQRWVNGEINHGMAVFTDDTSNGWQIRTIGNKQPAFRPALEVVYTTGEVKTREWKPSQSIIAAKDPGMNTQAGSFLDGGGEADYKEALLLFTDLMGEAGDRIGSEDRILMAKLVLETGGIPDTFNSADSDGAYSVHQMLVPWTSESTYGPAGVSIETGQVSEAFTSFLGMGENSRALADVTEIVNRWQAGENNHGFNIKPQHTDDWEIWWPGDGPSELVPRLVVHTEKALPQPEHQTVMVGAFRITNVAMTEPRLLSLSFESVSGLTYRLEISQDLDQWNTAQDVMALQNGTTTVTLPVETVQQRFFRLRVINP